MKFLKWFFVDSKREAPKAPPVFVDPRIEIDKLVAEKTKELQAKADADRVRYIVEVTTKNGEIYKTEEFEPYFNVYPRTEGYGHLERLRYLQQEYSDSKSQAKNFVQNAQYNAHLVQIGDEFICFKSIEKARLVRTKL